MPTDDQQSSRPAGGRRTRSAQASRERIILEAERLFSERGIEGPSLEEIGLAAAQRNKSAVQYHFGNRAGLVAAVLQHRTSAIDEVRTQMVADLMLKPDGPDLHDLIAALVMPIARQIQPGSRIVGLAVQASLQNGPGRRTTGSSELLRQVIRRVLADLPDDVFERRWSVALDTNLMAMAHIEREVTEPLEITHDRRLTDLIEFLVGGLSAPSAGELPARSS